MRREARLVLAAQVARDDRGEAADDQPFGVDQHPLLFDLGRLGYISLHDLARLYARAATTGKAARETSRGSRLFNRMCTRSQANSREISRLEWWYYNTARLCRHPSAPVFPLHRSATNRTVCCCPTL